MIAAPKVSGCRIVSIAPHQAPAEKPIQGTVNSWTRWPGDGSAGSARVSVRASWAAAPRPKVSSAGFAPAARESADDAPNRSSGDEYQPLS